MEPILLILTGEDRFLETANENTYFLGPWCFIQNLRFKFWNAPMERCVPNYIESETELERSSAYVLELIDRLLPALTSYLNQVTQQSRSLQYWQIVCSHWLTEFMCLYFDRYRRLQNASAFFKDQKVRIQTYSFSNESYSRPESYVDYYFNHLNNHVFNLYLFSDFLHLFPNLIIEKCETPPIAAKHAAVVAPVNKSSLKQTLSGLIAKVTLNKKVHIGNVKGLSGRSLRRLSLAPKLSWPRFKEKLDEPKQCFPFQQSLQFQPENDFERAVASNLTRYIPLENFLAFPNRKRKAKVFIGSDIYDQPQKYLLAEIIEQGGAWIGSQHGGTYAVLNNLPQIRTEYFFGQGFITWGWKEKNPKSDDQFIPMPSPYLSQMKDSFIFHKAEQVIYVSTAVPLYTYRFDSCAIPERQIEYFNTFAEFASLLAREKLSELRLKLYHYDFDLDLEGFYGQFFSKAQIIDRKTPLVQLLGTVKLVINDNLHTSFLESFCLNIPTVLLVNLSVFPVTETFKPWLDLLVKLKVCHLSPQSLTDHLDLIWADPSIWWMQAEVQELVRDFNLNYARNEPDWMTSWLNLTREICLPTQTMVGKS